MACVYNDGQQNEGHDMYSFATLSIQNQDYLTTQLFQIMTKREAVIYVFK